MKYKNSRNQSNIFLILEGFIFSIMLLFISSGLKVVNPKNSGWLSVGDGTMEISWEFFRHQPLIQFPLGLNPNYGLELSSTLAFDGQIPVMSLLFHPLSALLPDRFQYVGIFLLIAFLLNYFFAKKIFLELKFNQVNSTISSVILSMSPVILNRMIENTHYGLTSTFILLIAFLLVLRKDSNLIRWIAVYLLAVLIFLYYLPMIFAFHSIFLLNRIHKKLESLKSVIAKLFFILLSIFSVMYFIGYLGQGVSSKDVGYGLFRSTLTSLIDPSGWSRILPDLEETDGAYEGFAYLGLPTLILICIFTLLNLIRKNKFKNSDSSFKILWIAAVVLYLFSLSNKVSLGKIDLFSFTIPSQFEIITTSFRSTGRFAWPIVYVFFIWLCFRISKIISSRNFTVLLLSTLILNIFDTYPQISSQRNSKFSSEYRSKLTDPGWNSIRECYRKIRVYPPTVSVDGYYDFTNLAMDSKLAINTGRFGRFNQSDVLGAFGLMHKEFNTGVYREDSFYIFTNAEFIIPEIVNYQKNLATHTLNDDSAYGELNGYTFIAPNLQNCADGGKLKAAAKGFGAPETQKYQGEKLTFGKNFDTSKYILIGFSALEDWGVWSVDEISKISFNTESVSNFNSININARDLATPANEFTVSLNDSIIGTCNFSTEFSTCSLPFNFKTLETNILTLSFVPKIIRSPKDLGLSEDTRNLGFGMKSISFS